LICWPREIDSTHPIFVFVLTNVADCSKNGSHLYKETSLYFQTTAEMGQCRGFLFPWPHFFHIVLNWRPTMVKTGTWFRKISHAFRVWDTSYSLSFQNKLRGKNSCFLYSYAVLWHKWIRFKRFSLVFFCKWLLLSLKWTEAFFVGFHNVYT